MREGRQRIRGGTVRMGQVTKEGTSGIGSDKKRGHIYIITGRYPAKEKAAVSAEVRRMICQRCM